MIAFLAPLALLIERFVGYPPALVRAIGHPVIWMGALVRWIDRRSDPKVSPAARRRDGMLMLAALLSATLAVTVPVAWLARSVPNGWILEALLASTLLAQHELRRAVRTVATGLEHSLQAGRDAVRHIVGRDPDVLDEAGVSRAAIESLAESTSDGVVAPLFWLVLFGLPGIAAYKAINTADSMVGHLDERYRDFGWASARLDDAVNWLPARLTALLVAGAALFTQGADAERAWSTALRDAKKHASPNAGWPESAFAGALGFSLGGPRTYGGEVLDLPAFGTGRTDLTAADIRTSLKLYDATLNLTLALSLVVALVIWRT